MDPATMERLFEPFFTTKEMGQGTGLGLTTAYTAFRQHGGHIRCESQPGRGTVFSLFLPALSEQAPAPDAPHVAPAPGHRRPPARGGVILLVDDDPMVRAAIERVLQQDGHRVVSAESGRAALAAFGTQPGDFHLAIIDQCMPVLSGAETLAELRRLRPALPAIVFTGAAVSDAVDLRDCLLVTKPIDIYSFLEQVRGLLLGGGT
jgi:CheY-like chemotaxis protein